MNDDAMLTPEAVARLQAAVAAVARNSGWGSVAVIIERGQPRKIEVTSNEWLAGRHRGE